MTYEHNIHQPLPYIQKRINVILGKNPDSLDRNKTHSSFRKHSI